MEGPSEGERPLDETADGAALEPILNLAEEGAWDEVATQLRTLLSESPEDPTVLTWLGVAELELGLAGVAYERFRRALDAEPIDPSILTTAGAALARIDDPAAEAALRSAALLGPDFVAARLHYGAYLSREGMFDDAMVELTAALTLDTADPDVQRELGTLLSFMGRREQAVEAYEAAVRTDPDDGAVQMLLGLALLENDDTDAAAASLTEGARRTPDDFSAQLLAALAAHYAGWNNALEFVERARMVAEPDELDVVMEVEEVTSGESEDASEMLMDLSIGEARMRRALRP
jgi:Flp pilus assembly protein TadD